MPSAKILPSIRYRSPSYTFYNSPRPRAFRLSATALLRDGVTEAEASATCLSGLSSCGILVLLVLLVILVLEFVN